MLVFGHQLDDESGNRAATFGCPICGGRLVGLRAGDSLPPPAPLGRTGTVDPNVKSRLRLRDSRAAACNEAINQQMRIPEKTRHRRPLVGRRD